MTKRQLNIHADAAAQGPHMSKEVVDEYMCPLGDDAPDAKRPAAHRAPPASQTKASDAQERKQEAKLKRCVASKKRRRDSKKAPKVT